MDVKSHSLNKVDLASDDGGIVISKLGQLGKWFEYGGPLHGQNEQPKRTYERQ
jgi:hypothetical protein